MRTVRLVEDVRAPRKQVWTAWNRFDAFPGIMRGVESVREAAPGVWEWRVRIAGRTKTWRARITRRRAPQFIAWRSVSGTPTQGQASFEPMGDGRTRLRIDLAYQPEGTAELVADAVGLVERTVRSALRAFGRHVEADLTVRPGRAAPASA